MERRIAELPTEVTELILEKLDLLSYYCFSSVCSSWRSIALAVRQEKQKEKLQFSFSSSQPQLPYLMFPSTDVTKSHQSCFSLAHGKPFRLTLPEFRGVRCVGCSLGWLIMTSRLGENYLLNPASGVQLQLPHVDSLTSFRDYQGWPYSLFFICKAILVSPPKTAASSSSPPPSPVDFVVVAIYQERFAAFCRPGDQTWNPINYEGQERSDFVDIIFYNGQLYAVCQDYNLAILELGSNPRAAKCNVAIPLEHQRPILTVFGYNHSQMFLYLVESRGELLMVWRRYSGFTMRLFGRDVRWPDPETTDEFKVFKLDVAVPSWVEVESLGDQILFLGTSPGVSVSGLDYPQITGNSIYFTDDTSAGELDPSSLSVLSPYIGLFRLKTKTIDPITANYRPPSHYPPFWFTPNPW